MARPKRDFKTKRSYNLLIDEDVLDTIYCISVRKTRELGRHVTKAEIIRGAISFWLREKKEGPYIQPLDGERMQ